MDYLVSATILWINAVTLWVLQIIYLL